MTTNEHNSPMTFIISKWWGYIFSLFYLLYGGVSIVLSMMDSNVKADPTEMMQSFMFLAIGIIMITVAFGFRDQKIWGWYGLIGVNLLSIISLCTRLDDLASLILALICLAAVVLLFLPSTKKQIVGHA